MIDERLLLWMIIGTSYCLVLLAGFIIGLIVNIFRGAK